MKFDKLFAAGSLALLSSALGGEPVVPTGFLDASSLMVRAASNVDLTWEVKIPATEVEELVELPEDEPTIIAKEDVAFEVRMLGSEFAWRGDYVLTYGQYTYSGGADGESPWYTYFWGYGDDENALNRKTCDILKAGEELMFNFRGSKNGFRDMPRQHLEWFDRRWTGTGPSWYDNHTPAIILKNGDSLPDRVTPSGQTDISDFLAPYLEDVEASSGRDDDDDDDRRSSKRSKNSKGGKRIKIGPKDLIILAELNRDYGERGADYQDMVILVTFTKAEDSPCVRRWNGPTPPPVRPTIPTTTTPSTGGGNNGGGSYTPPPVPPKPEVPGSPE